MGPTAPVAVVAVVAALLAATATAQGPAGPQQAALSAEGQTPEPPGPARLEASGESDLSTAAHLGKAVTSPEVPGSPPGPDGGARTGALSDVPSQSSESEEGGRRESDSEEALETQGL